MEDNVNLHGCRELYFLNYRERAKFLQIQFLAGSSSFDIFGENQNLSSNVKTCINPVSISIILVTVLRFFQISFQFFNSFLNFSETFKISNLSKMLALFLLGYSQ